jgi:VanZ family protein
MRKILFLLIILIFGGVYYISGENIRFMDILTSYSSKELSQSSIALYEFYIRKTLHIISYFSITLLLFLFLYSFKGFVRKAGIFLAPLTTLALAVFDEKRQAEIPGRIGILADVFIDGMGILLAVVLIGFVLMMKVLGEEKETENEE